MIALGSRVENLFGVACALLAIACYLVPFAAHATTHGSIDSDVSFVSTGNFAAYQNLGNGNFTSGAAVTGLDLRASTTPGTFINISVRQYDIATRSSVGSFNSGGVSTVAGEHVYHFVLPNFIPDPSSCYELTFYQSDNFPTTFFGSSHDTYTASPAGCPVPLNSSDVDEAIQNPALNGHGLKDYSFVLYDDGNIPPPPPPFVPAGKTYGDIGYDFSFSANSALAAVQNLGNGSFAEGHTVTGADVRAGTVPGNFIRASVREFDGTGSQTHEYGAASIKTLEGNTLYHFDLPQFVPDSHRCYQLLFYQQYDQGWPSTYYGHSNDVYHASTVGCSLGQSSDNRAELIQNSALNVPGYVDYSFRIDTDGPTTTPACTQNCFDNVLFLPGIESSRLYRPQVIGGTEKKLWEPGFHDDLHDLSLTSNGESVRTDIYTKAGDIIDETPIGTNIYKSFIAKMDDLKAQGLINDWEAGSHDWRLSLDDILTKGKQEGSHISYIDATDTPYIVQELKQLASTSKSGKVTIIAHSNGGLVAKRLTELLGADAHKLIDKMIFVAVPQVGTPDAILDGLHGEPIGNGFAASKAAVRAFASTSPMMYHLLPSANYFTYVDTPVISFDPSLSDWISRYGAIIHSSERLHQFLTDTYGRVDAETGDTNQPTQLSNTLLSNAEALHADLDNWTPPSGVELIQIAGWGVPTTVTGITYKRKDSGVQPDIKMTIDGDGTVVVPSALWVSTTTAKDYWMNLKNYSIDRPLQTGLGFFPFNHSDILETKTILDFITDNVTESQRALGEYVYLSTAAPSSHETRLRYTLHSPLSLDLYDNQGHHTGVSTTTGQIEEQIPGTYYTEFGDAKYIFSDASSTAHVVMDGYANGTFTFNVDELLGDTLVASTTFQDIPTTPDTIVTLDTSSGVSALSGMHVDENGDGVLDINLTPKLNGVVTVDTTPPTTVATTTGTMGKNDWYIGNVLVTFNATDTESGVKATYFSLDGAATTTATSTVITTEGAHAIVFFSEDNAGNREAPQTILFKLDKTPPEVKLIFNPATQLLDIIGIDTLSSTTVKTTATSTLITDEAGHTLQLVFNQPKAKARRIALIFSKILYDDIVTSTASPTRLKYKWNANANSTYKMFASFLASGTSTVETHFRPKKNMTILTLPPTDLNNSDNDADSDIRPVRQTLSGMVVPYLITNRGSILVNY